MNSDSIMINRTFRLTHATAEIIRNAADVTGCSQGQILEECVLQSIHSVVSKLSEDQKRKADLHAQHLAELQKTKRPVGRPRNPTTQN